MPEQTNYNPETETERNQRFANGNITEEEIKAYWDNPAKPLFEYELIYQKKDGTVEKTKFRLRGLTEKFEESLLRGIKNAWDDISYESLRKTIEAYLAEKKIKHDLPLNVEYYILTDDRDQPFGMTGIYTVDMEGGAGMATRKKLDVKTHNFNTGLGWYAVNQGHQGRGLGKYLLNWTENLAKSRGAVFMFIDTDNWSNEDTARAIYEKRGYQLGFNVDNYFGQGRDRYVYYLDVAHEDKKEVKPPESISFDNKEEFLNLATKIYSPERLEEFKVVLDLLLQQQTGDNTIVKPEGILLRDEKGEIESFAIAMTGVYQNLLSVSWIGVRGDKQETKLKLLDTLKSLAVNKDRGILSINLEEEDKTLLQLGLLSGDGGIPGVYAKGDPTVYLQYTKRL